ncbi:uncharacterized protein LOC103863321 [Brassica rapa]|uniref:uncharacterized protein LOC103863321 n=1 Tax=Brassica campestris TaxID=3711 RepID=UPI00142E3DEE|nr:uncharacterized protein LOC103863321 [Brassica rapa]
MKNNIPSLTDSGGVEHTSEEAKGDIAVQYFTELFTSSRPSDATELLRDFVPRVTERMNENLTKPVTDAEIKKAAKAIKSDSSPGAYGMTGHFFQKFWPIIGPQITLEVKRFFVEGVIPQDWNFTQLCLLPKKPNPSLMTDLRPISLCAVSYKIVSSILCARLKGILPLLVSPTQGAFVAGMLISDNLLTAHEMVHGLKTNPNCKTDYIAIKTDMSKAYDRVEWNFLETLFLKMGFANKWIQWIMGCIRSVTYTVLMNGQTYGKISPERGIRQGDPLSPFLFILCAEALVHVMNRAELEGNITGMRLTKHCPSIQHLLFADDSLFLCKATLKECSNFLHCLDLYGKASGQEINFHKSSITFGAAIDPVMKRVISELLEIENEGSAGSYLGLPECFSGSKQKLLAFISEKLGKRLSGWYAKTLSLGGKEVLLKSIAMALPVYAMSCFRLTKHHCQKIMSAMAAFWWNESSDKRKIHWVSWPKLCTSKKSGGLGFRDIEDFNQALLAKQAWKLLNEPDSLLARVYKGRYYANKDFLECGKGYRPSYAWRSILFGRELLVKGLIKSIGNGRSTSVWSENWIMDSTPRRPVHRQLLFDVSLKVSELIDNLGNWNIERLVELFPPNEVQRIKLMTPGVVDDCYVWAFSRHGAYTVKTGYDLIMRAKNVPADQISPEEQSRVLLKRRVWKISTIPKIRMFLWRAVSGALAVADRLNSRGLGVDAICKICHHHAETINHVLFQCSMANETWAETGMVLPPETIQRSLEENLSYIFDLMEDNGSNESLVRSIPWWNNGSSLTNLNCELQRRELEWSIATSGVHQMMGSLSATYMRIGGTHHCIWIARDQTGNVSHHARDAIVHAPDRMVAEFRCIIWAITDLRDLGVKKVIMASDYYEVVEAIKAPSRWPRYRDLLQRIMGFKGTFDSLEFEGEKAVANSVTRDIAKSVLRNGRFQSYLAMGGPAWLHDRIARDAVRSDV